MFPKKEFGTIKDLKKLTIEKLHKLYENYAILKIKNQNVASVLLGPLSEKEKQDKIKNDKKTMTPPIEIFSKILSVLSPPLFQCSARLLLPLLPITSVQDTMTPCELNTLILEIFTKKYGKIFLRRGNNFSRNLIEKSWNNYNTYHGVSYEEIITKSQIITAITCSVDSLSISMNSALERIRTRSDKNYGKSLVSVNLLENREKLWDSERVQKCAKILLEASEHLKLHFTVTKYTPPHLLPTIIAFQESTVQSPIVSARTSFSTVPGISGQIHSNLSQSSGEIFVINLSILFFYIFYY